MIVMSLQFEDISVSTLDVPERLEPSSMVLSADTLDTLNVSDDLGTALVANPSLLSTNPSLLESLSLSEQTKQELVELRKNSGDLIKNKSGKTRVVCQSFGGSDLGDFAYHYSSHLIKYLVVS